MSRVREEREKWEEWLESIEEDEELDEYLDRIVDKNIEEMKEFYGDMLIEIDGRWLRQRMKIQLKRNFGGSSHFDREELRIERKKKDRGNIVGRDRDE